MNRGDSLQHYYPGAAMMDRGRWDQVLPVLRQALDGGDVDLSPESAGVLKSEGVYRYVAHQALARGQVLVDEHAATLRAELARGEVEKLSDDTELARLFATARFEGLQVLLFKGEALARTVYPAAGCRPTGDYDLLIRPADLPAFQRLLTGLCYGSSRFAGIHMFGEQAWTCPASVRGRVFLVDLHWDITNRRFFRNRAPFDALWDDSMAIPLETGSARIPSPAHSLLLACVHLAAMPVHETVGLRWLLDLRLLLDELEQAQFEKLAAQARDWGLADVLATYCSAAVDLLNAQRYAEQITSLAAEVSGQERHRYARACDQRPYDLLEYLRRLPGLKEKTRFIKEMATFATTWKSHRRQ